jgi:hypothetical protein
MQEAQSTWSELLFSVYVNRIKTYLENNTFACSISIRKQTGVNNVAQVSIC